MSDSGLFFALHDRQGNFIEDFTPLAMESQLEWLEGPYQLSFRFEPSPRASIDELTQWFTERMMYQVRLTFDNNEVFRGHVYNMTLEDRGMVASKDMNEFANAVKCRTTDGTTVLYTGWYVTQDGKESDGYDSSESLDRYGRIESVVSVSANSSGEAAERAKAELSYRNTDKPTSWAYKSNDRPGLSVIAVGNMVLANRIHLLENTVRYGDVDWGDETTVSAEILRVVEMCQDLGGYLYPLHINSGNDTETVVGVQGEVGTFDRILELSRLRDSDGNYYRLSIEPDGGVIYDLFDQSPIYKRYPPPGGVEWPDGSLPTWDAVPGVVQNVDPYTGPAMPGWWLSSANLAFIERTSMRDGDTRATFHSRQYDIGDYYRAFEANQRWLE